MEAFNPIEAGLQRGIEYMRRKARELAPYAVFCEDNYEVVAVRDIPPHAKVYRTIEGRVDYVEHYPPAERGTVLHTVNSRGYYDLNMEVTFPRGRGKHEALKNY